MIENLEGEIWMIHPLHNWFAASNLGRVKSLERTVMRKDGKPYPCQEKLIKPRLTINGYLRFQINKNGEIVDQPYVHRFIWECFYQCILPKGMQELQINHKNEDKTDNRIENLELCTPQYNANYGTRNKKLYKRVGQYDLDGNLIKIWKSVTETVQKGGFIHSAISECCNSKRKTHKGYLWKFIDE